MRALPGRKNYGRHLHHCAKCEHRGCFAGTGGSGDEERFSSAPVPPAGDAVIRLGRKMPSAREFRHAQRTFSREIVSDITPGSGMRLIAEVQPKTAGRDSCDFLLH